MKKIALALCVMLLALGASTAFAADITGKWTGNFGDMTISFEFKQDGGTLTGTAQGPQGDPIPLKEGKVEGDKISFLVVIDAGGGEMKIKHQGTIKGDEIALSVKTEGGGEGPEGTMTLTRAK